MYELVSVIFPFADNATKGKPRPGFIISLPVGKHGQVIVAYVTTNLTEKLATDIILDSSKDYFPETGLIKTSLLKLHRLSTFQPSALNEGAGHLPEKLIPELKKKLRKVFGL